MSAGRTIYVLIKLLPSILALRKDRKKWTQQEKNTIDSEQFRKNYNSGVVINPTILPARNRNIPFAIYRFPI